MKERVLLVGLIDAVDAFDLFKWKFYQVEEDYVKVEIPRGSSESYVVEMPFSNEAQMKEILKKLEAEGFIQQKIRLVKDF